MLNCLFWSVCVYRELLERLKNYMHADGAGLPAALMQKSSQALVMTIEASLS